MHYAVEGHTIVERCALCLSMNAQAVLSKTATLSLKCLLMVYIWAEKGVVNAEDEPRSVSSRETQTGVTLLHLCFNACIARQSKGMDIVHIRYRRCL